MDQRDPSGRRQSRQHYSQQRPDGSGSAQGQLPTPVSFPQSPYIQQSPSSPPSVSITGSDTQQIYGFAAGAQYGTGSAMQANPLQYGQDIQASDAQRAQSQQYSQYGPGIMYSMNQPHAAQPGQPPYEQVPQYQSRTASVSASETLATQFGMPAAAQYYLAGQSVPSNAAVSELPIPAQYAVSDAYPEAGVPAMDPYAGNIMDPAQSAGYASFAQQGQYTPQAQAPSDEHAFETYQSQIRNIFTLARDGSLRDSGSRLLDASQYLLGNVESLGLTRDDETLHDGRIRLWDEFNRAWLVTLQRQLDMTQQVIQTNQPLGDLPNIMNVQTLERLSSELVRLCDSIEKHGLVDYQMGVAEEEIVELLLRCISLLNGNNKRASQGGAQNEPSTAGASRRR